jgi:hypothetical protein
MAKQAVVPPPSGLAKATPAEKTLATVIQPTSAFAVVFKRILLLTPTRIAPAVLLAR